MATLEGAVYYYYSCESCEDSGNSVSDTSVDLMLGYETELVVKTNSMFCLVLCRIIPSIALVLGHIRSDVIFNLRAFEEQSG